MIDPNADNSSGAMPDLSDDVDLSDASSSADSTPLAPAAETSNIDTETATTAQYNKVIHNVVNPDNYRPAKDPRADFEKALAANDYSDAEIADITLSEIPSLPSTSYEEASFNLDKVPDTKLTSSKEIARWAFRAEAAYKYTHNDGMYLGALSKGAWTNCSSHNNINTATAYPKPEKALALSGEKATIAMAQHLGLGTYCNVKLPHSGIYLTLKPPSDGSILQVTQQLITSKIKLGRETYGLAFSNFSVYTKKILSEFVLAHIHNTTIGFNKDNRNESSNLLDYIKDHDYFILLNGLAATMYPRGLMYESPCTVDPTKCNHVVKDTIVMTKLQHEDESSFTEWHKSFMLTRVIGTNKTPRSVAEIKQYQTTLPAIADKTIEIVSTDGAIIFMTLTVPSIASSIEQGTKWIDKCVAMVESNAGLDLSEKAKNNLFAEQAKASEMNQYCHYVKSIKFSEYEEVTSQEDISNLLSTLSQDDLVRKQFFTSVKEFITSTTIGIIGIPAYECPACQQVVTTDVARTALKEIIPLDVPSLFFDLLTLRLNKIIRR